MQDEYDFNKGERGGFYHLNAKFHLPEVALVCGTGNCSGVFMHEYPLTTEAEALILNKLHEAFPNSLGIYAFGSRVQGTATAQSDLDIAINQKTTDGPSFGLFISTQ